jgi:hypothetical protein
MFIRWSSVRFSDGLSLGGLFERGGGGGYVGGGFLVKWLSYICVCCGFGVVCVVVYLCVLWFFLSFCAVFFFSLCSGFYWVFVWFFFFPFSHRVDFFSSSHRVVWVFI